MLKRPQFEGVIFEGGRNGSLADTTGQITLMKARVELSSQRREIIHNPHPNPPPVPVRGTAFWERGCAGWRDSCLSPFQGFF
jgi:hypothetical protein